MGWDLTYSTGMVAIRFDSRRRQATCQRLTGDALPKPKEYLPECSRRKEIKQYSSRARFLHIYRQGSCSLRLSSGYSRKMGFSTPLSID